MVGIHSQNAYGRVRLVPTRTPLPASLLFLHGRRDWVVPIVLGERLYALANEPKRFVRFSDAGHEDLDLYGAQNAVRTFLVQP